MVLASLAGGMLAGRYGLELNYQLSVVSCALALLGTLLLREPRRSLPAEAKQTMSAILRGALRFFRRRPDALAILLQATATAAFLVYIDEFWQLYLVEVGVPVGLFGVVTALFAVTRIGGDLQAGRLAARGRTDLCMTALAAMVSLGLLAAGVLRSWAALPAMMLAALACEAMQVVAMGYLHLRADSAARATIESLGSLMERAWAVVLGVLFAYVAGRQTLFDAYGALAMGCVLCTILFAARGRRKERR